MFTEENAVEVVRRNIIMLRNTYGKSGIRRQLFNSSSLWKLIHNGSSTGISVGRVVELCELLRVDALEMFYVDSEWDLSEKWDAERTDVREFANFMEDYPLTYDNMGKVFLDNVDEFCLNNDLTRTHFWNIISSVSVTKILHAGMLPISVKILGRVCDRTGATPEDLLYNNLEELEMEEF